MRKVASRPALLLYGGSFDPPHYGHVLALAYLLSRFPQANVYVVPCKSHALGKPLSPFPQRLALCRAAFSFLGSRVRFSRVEATRPGPSYALDTALHFKHRFPRHRLIWVIGSDLQAEVRRWHRFADLSRLVELEVLPRAGFVAHPGKAGLLFPNLASRTIRARLARKKNTDVLIPPRVAQLVRRYKLYR